MKLMRIYEDVTAPDNFGRELKKLFAKNEAYHILDSETESEGGTYTMGGCYVLAKALNELIPSSEIWGVYRDGGKGIKPRGYADHFVLKIGDMFYDSSGGRSASRVVSMWKPVVKNPALKQAHSTDVHPETPSGDSLKNKIKDYIISSAKDDPTLDAALYKLMYGGMDQDAMIQQIKRVK